MTMPSPLDLETAGAGIRAMSAEWFAFNGINRNEGAQVMRSLADYGRAPADEAWVYRCVALKAGFAQSVPLLVEVRDGSGWITADATSDGAALDLQGLLDDVNPVNMNGSDLKAWSVAATSVWGETYWRKVRGRFGGAPQELFWLRSPDLTPNKGRVWIDSYDYQPSGGAAETYLARDIVPFRRLNLEDPTRGLSPLASARFDIAVNRQAAEWQAEVLANWGIPPLYWQIPKDADFTPQDQSLVRRALRALRGPRNQGKTPIVPQGLEAKILSLNPKDADWLSSRKISRMTICAVEGVPLVLAGDDDKNTVYANLRDAERIFARYMITELDWLADGVNGWLVPDFDPSKPGRRRIRVRFDYGQIEALQAPLREDYLAWQSWLDRKVAVPNEARRHFKIGPDVPWGNDPLLSTTVATTDSPEVDEDKQRQAMGEEPAVDEEPDLEGAVAADALRAVGRGLYRHPAVRSWIANPSAPLDAAALLGRRPAEPTRIQIEAGLRRRDSAGQIAESLSEGARA
jgi:HK97 family phage portal protein